MIAAWAEHGTTLINACHGARPCQVQYHPWGRRTAAAFLVGLPLPILLRLSGYLFCLLKLNFLFLREEQELPENLPLAAFSPSLPMQSVEGGRM